MTTVRVECVGGITRVLMLTDDGGVHDVSADVTAVAWEHRSGERPRVSLSLVAEGFRGEAARIVLAAAGEPNVT